MRAIAVALALAACWTAAPPPTAPPPSNAKAPGARTLRITPEPPRPGDVRTETYVQRQPDGSITRRVERTEVLDVDGMIETRVRVTFVEATSPKHDRLAGQTFVVVATAGGTDVEGAIDPATRAQLMQVTKSFGTPNRAQVWVGNKTFEIGRLVPLPHDPGDRLPASVRFALTLRAFDELRAMFEVHISSDDGNLAGGGDMIVDRLTGREVGALMRLTSRGDAVTELEYSATFGR